jgi:hypothetical protein
MEQQEIKTSTCQASPIFEEEEEEDMQTTNMFEAKTQDTAHTSIQFADS